MIYRTINMEKFVNKIITNTLNISPYVVDDISYFDNNETLNIEITLKHTVDTCPYCHCRHFRSKGYYKKKVTHLLDNLTQAVIVIKIPRKQCIDCLKTFSEQGLLSPSSSSLSYTQILQIMSLLREPTQTFRSVSRITGIPETTVLRIFDRYCPNFDFKLPKILSFDEVYIKQSDTNSKFSCILYDFHTKKIIDVLAYRRKEFLANYFTKKPQNERLNVEFVCIDMYKPYKDIATRYLTNATICVDSFHVIKLLNDCFSLLRIRIMKQYDFSSIEYYLLKKWHHLLSNRRLNIHNTPKYNHRLKRHINYAQLKELLLGINNHLTKGYQLKEEYISFNETCSNPEEAFEQIKLFIVLFSDLNIPEFTPFITALCNWHIEIANSFIFFDNRRINNSYAEGINSLIKTIILNTRGIKNSTRRRNRLMYTINKSDYLKN